MDANKEGREMNIEYSILNVEWKEGSKGVTLQSRGARRGTGLRKRIDDRNGVVGHAGSEVFGVERVDSGFETSGEQQAIPMRQAIAGHE